MLLNQEKPSVVNLFQPNRTIDTDCFLMYHEEVLNCLASERDLISYVE